MHRKNGLIITGTVVMAMAMMGGICRGEILTFAFEGTVQVVSDPPGLLGWVQPGDRTTYTFTFDADMSPSVSSPYLAEYPGISAAFTAGTRSFVGTPPLITIQDTSNGGQDSFNVQSYFTVDGMGAMVYFRLVDFFGNALSDKSLPLEPYDLARFPHQKEFSSTVVGPLPDPYPPYPTFWGAIDSFHVALPEPASLLLVVAGGLVLGIQRR